MRAAMEKEKSNCQILMTRSLQWERDEDWVGVGGRGEEGGTRRSEHS